MGNKTSKPAKAEDTADAFELVVVEAFQGYEKGQIVTDPGKIEELLDSEWQSHFIKKPKQA